MKSEFSTTWKASKQPRKQRKYNYNAPLHIKRRQLSTHLSKELREKYERRNVVVRKEDKVKITRGQFKGKTGKIIKVLTKDTKVHVENIQNIKNDGTKVYYPIHPSNLTIIELDLTDKRRNIIKKKNG